MIELSVTSSASELGIQSGFGQSEPYILHQAGIAQLPRGDIDTDR
jgi:hypothetical protein